MNPKTPKIYLLRHGQTEWSLSGKHTGSTDIALTEEGKREAKCIAKAIKNVHFKKVFSSPLIRALETAHLAGIQHLTQDPDLVEWNYGDFEGRKTIDIIKEHPNWNLFDHGAPHGETSEDVGLRADRAIKMIRAVNGDVAIFSHGHFLRAFTARWLGLPAHCGKLFFLNTASLTILGYEHDETEPVLKLWNSTAHLE